VVLAPIAEFHPAQLRREGVAAAHHLVAEAVGSEHGTGMNHAPCPHLRAVVEHRIREDDRAGADPAAGHDLGTRMDRGTRSDLHVGADHGEGMDVGIGTDAGSGVDNGPRAHADTGRGAGRPEPGDHRGERPMHVGHFDRGPVERPGALRHDRRTGAALRQQMQLVRGIDERDVGRPGRLERGCATDRQPCGGADDRSLDMAGKFFERDGHGVLHGAGPLRSRSWVGG
jgi:hypothetical protein